MNTPPPLHGLHHVTAVTASGRSNFEFYTRVLGMRLVKKTVNQDDVSSYHLFYADALGSAGTEMTFFEWAQAGRAVAGAGFVGETALRVPGGAATLELWRAHLVQAGVQVGEIAAATAGQPVSLPFRDPEGQALRLFADARSTRPNHPWRGSPLPPEASIVGLGAVTLEVRDVATTAHFLSEALGFRPHPEDAGLFEVGPGGVGAQLRLQASTTHGAPGAGGVHHVAWAVSDVEAQNAWLNHLAAHGIHASGLVDRFYFQSVYFRIPGGILFELATEGPGFTADGEPLETLGEQLSLPPFLEKSRASIEAGLQPLDTPSV